MEHIYAILFSKVTVGLKKKRFKQNINLKHNKNLLLGVNLILSMIFGCFLASPPQDLLVSESTLWLLPPRETLMPFYMFYGREDGEV